LTDLVREAKDENKVVADWLLHYPKRLAAYEALRDAFAYPGTVAPEDRLPISTNRKSDPTAQIAIQLVTGEIVPAEDLDEEQWLWLKLVEDVERALPWKAQVILRLRREVVHKQGMIRKGKYRGRPAWIPFVQHHYAEEMSKRTGKKLEDVWVDSPQAFTSWWGKIVDLAARAASKRGLLL